ncbi:MAG: type VI secretion system tube protein Hcp [Proteobacteria bacterium]|nr:type VI secretion system tube protein Hcp [Pseudomonadota bacterium]
MSQLNSYLKIEGARQGPIKGEASEPGHLDDIELTGWSWGMDATTAAYAKGAVNTSLREMVLHKRTDRATTALMAALRNNEPLKRVTLTGRKAGGGDTALDFLKIVLEQARLTAHSLTATPGSDAYEEVFHLSFLKVSVTYLPQADTGSGAGATTFETEVTPA